MITCKYISAKGLGHFMTFIQGHLGLCILYCHIFKAVGPAETRFHMESSWVQGTKIFMNGYGHLTNMAVMSIYVKA